jgi:hypothetical protein
MTFIQKIRTFNVDEIDTLLSPNWCKSDHKKIFYSVSIQFSFVVVGLHKKMYCQAKFEYTSYLKGIPLTSDSENHS